jgi:CRP/FNR family transcriptional activator FtrB
MLPEDAPFIRRLPLFRNMTTANFTTLTEFASMQRVPTGHLLVEQGAAADHLFIVVEGAVELFATWGGRDCTMGVVRPVGTFILAACIKDAPYLMSARTLAPARVVLLPAPDLRAVFRRDPDFAMSVIDELAGDFRRVVRHAKGLKLRDTQHRIAAYLLEQSQAAGGALTYMLQVEKRHVASYLGMTPENLSRGLRLLEPQGVSVSGLQVTIHDLARLVAFVEPDVLMDGPDMPGGGAGVGLPAPATPRPPRG